MPFRDSIRFESPTSIIELQPDAGFDPTGDHPDQFALQVRVQLPGLRASTVLHCRRAALAAFAQGLLAARHDHRCRVRLTNDSADQTGLVFEQRDHRALLHLQGHSQRAGTLFMVDAVALGQSQVADWHRWCLAWLASGEPSPDAGHHDWPGCGSRPAAASDRPPSSDTSPAAMNAPA